MDFPRRYVFFRKNRDLFTRHTIISHLHYPGGVPIFIFLAFVSSWPGMSCVEYFTMRFNTFYYKFSRLANHRVPYHKIMT